MFRFTSFGSDIFEISNYLTLKLNWHLVLIIEQLFEPFAKFISIHNFWKTIEMFDLNILFEKVVTDQV